MVDVKPVPIPRRQTWLKFKRSILPAVVWLGAVGVVVLLMNMRMSPANAVGLAEEQQVDVTPLLDGTIRVLYANLYDTVERGSIVAVLDDALISQQIETSRRELRRLQSEYEQLALELNAERMMAKLDFVQQVDGQKLDALAALRRLELDRDQARIDYMDRRIDREAEKAELVYRNALAEAYSKATDVIATIEVEEALALRAALEVRVNQSEETVEQARLLFSAAESRLKDAQAEFDAMTSAGDRALQELLLAYDPAIRLRPMRDAIEVQESFVEELILQKGQLILHSPIDGIIASVEARVGQTIMRGTRVVEVQSPEVPYIRGWIDQRSNYQPQVGEEVEVMTRSLPRRSMKGQVMKVGLRVERYPLRLRPNPDLPEFGRPVVIQSLGAGLSPGEVLDIRFL